MKKALALVLAAMMAIGTASVAFAAGTVEFKDGDIWYTYSTDNLENLENSNHNDNGNFMKPLTGKIKPGKTVYYPLELKGGYEEKDMGKVKLKATWEEGADVVESVKVYYLRDANGDMGYFAGVATKAGVTTKGIDLAGEIKIYKSSPNSEWDTLKVNFEEDGYVSKTFDDGVNDDYTVYGDGTSDPEGPTHVVKFEDLEDITIEFDGVGEFEINVADQEKLYLGFNHKAVSEIADKYDYAELEFTNFPGEPAFFRTGLFSLYAEKDSFIYALNDGKLEAVKATYDEDYEAMKFALRQFPESLIISDTELEIVNDTTTEGETKPENVKPNPGTGR